MVSLPKPEIKSVLNNLNVHLEDELALYRRQLRGQSPPPAARLKRTSKKQLDLISIQAREIPPAEKQASAQPPRGPALPPPPPNPFLRQTEGQVPDGETAAVPPSGAGATLDSGPQDVLSADSSDTAVTAASGDGQGLALHQESTAPDGYLASSEELLKNLSDESDVPQSTDPQAPYNPNRENKLLAPLKVGALLLLLVGCVGAGYAIVNPSVLDPVRALFPQNDGAADGNSASVDGDGSSTGAGDPTYKPPGPDLSTREFVELDLESLSTLEVNQQAPIPSLGTAPTLPGGANTTQLPAPSAQAPAAESPNATASPTPQAAPTPQATPAPAQPPSQSSGQATAPTSSAALPTVPATSPAASASSPASTPPAVGQNYYVIADYTGDSSLTKAREVVSDAFVRNFNEGSRIQLGAFDNGDSAQQLIQELQSRGLTGRLYGPTDE